MTAPAKAAPMRECTCNGKCPMTDDQHWVDCPAHAYHDAWIKMQSKAAPMREDVTQADREAAALIAENIGTYGFDGNDVAAIRNGIWDDGELGQIVQLVSRHRLAHTARPDAGDGTWGPITEWEMINRLRDEEADSVTVLCDNPEGPPNNAVECCGFWTGFADRRFEGATVHDALAAAVAAKDEASKVGYPPMSRPDAGDEDVERVACAIYNEDSLDGLGESTKSVMMDRARAALAAMREGVDRGMVQFLLDRLADFENGMTSEEDASEWHGHVRPAIARLSAALDTDQPR